MTDEDLYLLALFNLGPIRQGSVRDYTDSHGYVREMNAYGRAAKKGFIEFEKKLRYQRAPSKSWAKYVRWQAAQGYIDIRPVRDCLDRNAPP